MTPSLSTANLVLRPLTKATAKNIAWLRDPDVVRFSEQRHRKHHLSSQLDYIRSFSGNSHLWGVYHVESGNHIGNLSSVHDEPNNVSDLSIMIGDTKAWRKGFGTEAWARACVWLLDQSCGGVRKVEAGCARSNEGMLKILRGTGFVQEGERLNHFLIDGAPVSAVLFGRMR